MPGPAEAGRKQLRGRSPGDGTRVSMKDGTVPPRRGAGSRERSSSTDRSWERSVMEERERTEG